MIKPGSGCCKLPSKTTDKNDDEEEEEEEAANASLAAAKERGCCSSDNFITTGGIFTLKEGHRAALEAFPCGENVFALLPVWRCQEFRQTLESISAHLGEMTRV